MSEDRTINPETGKLIKIGGPKYQELLKSQKYQFDPTTHRFVSNESITIDDFTATTIEIIEEESNVSVTNIDPVTDQALNQCVISERQQQPVTQILEQTREYLETTGIHYLNGTLNDTLTHLVHISDVHIPININTNGRRNEYLEVFQNLYGQLRTLAASGDRFLIVITGDLLHTKINLKPDCSVIAREFLHNLAEIAPVLLITGNHDMNEYNLEETCTLTSIVQYVNPRIHYLQRSGMYDFNGWLFVVSSLKDGLFLTWDSIPTEIKDKYKNQITCLYHGFLTGAVTDTGYSVQIETDTSHVTTCPPSFSSRYRKVNDFRGFPLVLLGDVHKQQSLRPDDSMAYAGSLLQLDRSESLLDHGFLYWNLTLRNYQFHRVKNNYGFIKLRVEHGQLVNPPQKSHVPNHPTIYCSLHRTTLTQFDQIREQLTYLNPIDIRLDNLTGSNRTRQQIIEKSDGAEINSNQIIEDRNQNLITSVSLDDELALINEEELREMHREINDKVINEAEETVSNLNCWDLVALEFQNIFSFGSNKQHHINFETGVTNISARNQCGKSSICYMIMFALFHKTNFETGKGDIINKRSQTGYIKLTFRYNNQYYLVEKNLTKTRKRSESVESYRTDFWLIQPTFISSELAPQKHFGSSQLVSLNATTATETVDRIQQFVGTFENFIANNTLLTRLTYSILYQKPTDRIRKFLQLFRLDKYNAHLAISKTQLSTAKANATRARAQLETLETLQKGKENVKELTLRLGKNETELQSKQALLLLYSDEITTLNEEMTRLREEIRKGLDIPRVVKPMKTQEELLDRETDLLEELDKQCNTEFDTTPVSVLQYQITELDKSIGSLTIEILQSRLATINEELEQVTVEEPQKRLEELQEELCRDYAKYDEKVANYEEKVATLKGTEDEAIQVKLAENTLSEREIVTKITELRLLKVPIRETLEEVTREINELEALPFERLKRKSIATTRQLIDEYHVKTGELRGQLNLNHETIKYEGEIHDTLVIIEELRSQIRELLPIPELGGLEQEKLVTIACLDEITKHLTFLRDQKQRLLECIGSIDPTAILTEIDTLLSTKNNEITVDVRLLRDCRQSLMLQNSGVFRDLLELTEQINLKRDEQEKIKSVLELKSIIQQRTKENIEIGIQNKIITGQIKWLENSILHEKIDNNTRMVKSLEYQIELLEKQDRLGRLQELLTQIRRNLEIESEISDLETLQLSCQCQVLKDEISVLETSISERESEFEELERLIIIEKEEQECQNILRQIENRHKFRKQLLIAKLREELNQVENDIDTWIRYLEVEDKLRQVEKLETEFVQKKCDYETVKSQMAQTETTIALLTLEVKQLLSQIEEGEKLRLRIRETLEETVTFEHQMELCKRYIDLWNPKTLPLQILRTKLAIMEPMINDLFSRYCRYQVKLDASDDSHLYIHVIPKTDISAQAERLSIDRLSGSEYSFLNLSFKSVCNQLAHSGRSSLFIIDEAMDSLDDFNWQKALPEIFQMMRLDYLTILFISHREIDESMIDHRIKLERDNNGTSCIV